MFTITQDVKTPHIGSPTDLLHALDLAEWEAEYHWHQFEAHTLDASRHLAEHDAAQARRQQLSSALNATLSIQVEMQP